MERSLVLATKGIRYGQAMLLLTIGAFIILCNWCFAYQGVVPGIVMTLGLVILIYILTSATHLDQRIVDCAESMAIIPLWLHIVFLSSCLFFFLNQQYFPLIAYSIILVLCLRHIYEKKMSLREVVGLRIGKLLKHSLLGLALAIPVGAVGCFLSFASTSVVPTLPTFEMKSLLINLVYMVLFVGLAEELLFRGLIQRGLMGVFGTKWGIFGAALLFAVAHLTQGLSLGLGFIFVMGMVLGYIYYKTKSLVAPVVLHGMGNVMLVSVMPYIFYGSLGGI